MWACIDGNIAWKISSDSGLYAVWPASASALGERLGPVRLDLALGAGDGVVHPGIEVRAIRAVEVDDLLQLHVGVLVVAAVHHLQLLDGDVRVDLREPVLLIVRAAIRCPLLERLGQRELLGADGLRGGAQGGERGIGVDRDQLELAPRPALPLVRGPGLGLVVDQVPVAVRQ
jgi:hypothetical protein